MSLCFLRVKEDVGVYVFLCINCWKQERSNRFCVLLLGNSWNSVIKIDDANTWEIHNSTQIKLTLIAVSGMVGHWRLWFIQCPRLHRYITRDSCVKPMSSSRTLRQVLWHRRWARTGAPRSTTAIPNNTHTVEIWTSTNIHT